jgi:hypothetical protein
MLGQVLKMTFNFQLKSSATSVEEAKLFTTFINEQNRLKQ